MKQRYIKYTLLIMLLIGIYTSAMSIVKPSILVYQGSELKYHVPISTDVHIITDITNEERVFVVNYPGNTVIGTRLRFGTFDFEAEIPDEGEGEGEEGGNTGGSGSGDASSDDGGNNGDSGSGDAGSDDGGNTSGSGSGDSSSDDGGNNGGSGSDDAGSDVGGNNGGSGSGDAGSDDGGNNGGSGSDGSDSGESTQPTIPPISSIKTTTFRRVVTNEFVGIEYISNINDVVIKVDGMVVPSVEVKGMPWKRVPMSKGEHTLEIGNVFKGIKVTL